MCIVEHPRRMNFSRAVVALCALITSNAFAGSSAYLPELIDQAQRLKLAERKEWHNLLHYKPDWLLPGVHSLVDSPGFFNAPDGKTNPQAELDATLAAFFSTLEETDKQQNPQCAFIARYHWLKEQLHFDANRLAPQPCRRYRAWRDAMDPVAVTLVFASAYLNSPASMYGHTLLRIDGREQDERSRLLAYAINFSAVTDETNGIVFAVKGLLGGYPGKFSSAPYYLKVREYNDVENRDLWEYQLTLTPPEIELMLMHTWEIGPNYFEYYFFDENCSYQLLSLLEVARPSLDLTDRFPYWAIPSDTVRAVVDQPGLVRATHYRPSRATLIRHRLQYATGEEKVAAKALAEQKTGVESAALQSLPPEQEADVLELAYEYGSYLRIKNGDRSKETNAALHALLTTRSKLDVKVDLPEVPRPAVSPEQGHGTARLALGVGRDDQRNFIEVRARPSFHDLLDAEEGYIRGGQLEFFDLHVRHYDDGETRIEKFYPLRIVSLAPRDEFFRSTSWRIRVGWERIRLNDNERPLVFDLTGGPGYAWDIGDGMPRALLYAFIDATLQVDGELDSGYSFGAGPVVGASIDLNERWRVNTSVRGQRFFSGDQHSLAEATLEARYTLGKQMAATLELARGRDFDMDRRRVGAFWNFYF